MTGTMLNLKLININMKTKIMYMKPESHAFYVHWNGKILEGLICNIQNVKLRYGKAKVFWNSILFKN